MSLRLKQKLVLLRLGILRWRRLRQRLDCFASLVLESDSFHEALTLFLLTAELSLFIISFLFFAIIVFKVSDVGGDVLCSPDFRSVETNLARRHLAVR